jgi:hypothetical protein
MTRSLTLQRIDSLREAIKGSLQLSSPINRSVQLVNTLRHFFFSYKPLSLHSNLSPSLPTLRARGSRRSGSTTTSPSRGALPSFPFPCRPLSQARSLKRHRLGRRRVVWISALAPEASSVAHHRTAPTLLPHAAAWCGENASRRCPFNRADPLQLLHLLRPSRAHRRQ